MENQQHGHFPGQQAHGGHLHIGVGDKLHVLRPKLIVAFKGASSQRADRLLDLKGMYRKKKFVQSDISGPGELVLALPTGYFLKELAVEEGGSLLFDTGSLLYYSQGIEMKTVVLTVKNMLVTRDFMRMKFFGSGRLGILSQGPLYELELSPDDPVYVDAGSLVAYPEGALAELCVYGNHLASQRMNYQWKMTGRGRLLLQTGRPEAHAESGKERDPLIKRVLREVIPFGGVFIK